MSLVMSINVSAQRLSERQLHLATCAALEAQGDLVRLEPAEHAALDAGLLISVSRHTRQSGKQLPGV